MWEGISALLTLAVLVVKALVDHKNQIEKKYNDGIQKISDAVASGDVSRINSIVQQLRK